MKTRFPIKVKEIVIDAEEYEKTVSEIEMLKKSNNDANNKMEEINIFFQRLKESGVIFEDRSSYMFNPSNKLYVTTDSMQRTTIISIQN